MSLRYTSKLIFNSIRYINCKYSLRKINSRSTIFYNPKYILRNNVNHYRAVTSPLRKVSQIPQYIKDTNSIDNVLGKENIGVLSQEQCTLLIKSCGKLLSNKPLKFRIDLCNEVFFKLSSAISLTIENYNTYIKVNTENEVNILHNDFIKLMKCEPNEDTFRLLLENVCERGDVIQAYEILSKMKTKDCPIDDRVFNALVLAHSIAEGLEGVKKVLATMQAAHVTQTSDTNWNILLGLASRNDRDTFVNTIENNIFTYDDDSFLKLLLKLAINDNEELIQMIKRKFIVETLPKYLLYLLDHLCIHLIHRNKSEIAMQIYCSFTMDLTLEDYGIFLLKEMLYTNTDSNTILNLCKMLKDNEKNLLALESITEISLKNLKIDRVWSFFESFEILRPHYFWPLLLNAGRENGEGGVIGVLEKMRDLKVEIDKDTLEGYVLPLCSLDSPIAFLVRVQHLNLPLKQVLTSIIALFLKSGEVRRIHELCDNYDVELDANRLIHPLAVSWRDTRNQKLILRILKRICENNEMATNSIRSVLALVMKFSKTDEDYNDCLTLVKLILEEKLLKDYPNNEVIAQILEMKDSNKRKRIENILEEISDISLREGKMHIIHPKFMTVDQLECHLIELQNKKMKTRGVLRHLIQGYSKLGNHTRINELKTLLNESGYVDSPGMKASLLQTYVKTGQSEMALVKYRELQTQHPNFKLDEHKILDLVTLLISEDNYSESMNIFEMCQKRHIRGGSNIENNCIDLLNAAKNSEQAVSLFNTLTQLGFCRPRNIVLGPVLRSYIKNNDLEGAVNFYKDCSKNYKCTPLQVEFMQILLENRNEALLESVLDATANVYGPVKTQMSFAVALTEMRMKKPLLKLITETDIPNSELRNRCEKWEKDDKLEQLLIFAEAVRIARTNNFDMDIINASVIRVFANRNDCDGAIHFVNSLKENDVIISGDVTKVFNSLLKRNKIETKDNMSLNINK